MARIAGSLTIAFCLAVLLWLAFPFSAFAQETLGSVVGRVRVLRGDTPAQRILVSVYLHNSPVDSVYTDAQGQFGFHGLNPESYEVRVDDEHYQPVRVMADIYPISVSPTAYVDIQLIPRTQATASPGPRPQGSNPNLMDVREFAKDFPKKAVKEFERGIEADRENKKDEAIAHYRKAIELAPDFYPAHNNLGSDELSQSHFEAARHEFEKVVELNQSDATANFNLANVCMLMGQLPDAQKFLDSGFRRQPDSALGKFLQGTLDIRTNHMREAELTLQQAIRLDPGMAQPRLQLINLFLKEGKQADAVGQLHEFLIAFPSSPFSDHAKQLLQRLEQPNAVQIGPKPSSAASN